MVRTLAVLISLVLAAEAAFPARAVYHCSVTGKWNFFGCCCRDEARETTECAKCEPEATAMAADTTSGLAACVCLSSRCCSISYEKSSKCSSAPRGAAESEWKQALADAQLFIAAQPVAVEPIDLFARESFSRRGPPLRDHSPPPLFLLHRSLLL